MNRNELRYIVEEVVARLTEARTIPSGLKSSATRLGFQVTGEPLNARDMIFGDLYLIVPNENINLDWHNITTDNKPFVVKVLRAVTPMKNNKIEAWVRVYHKGKINYKDPKRDDFLTGEGHMTMTPLAEPFMYLPSDMKVYPVIDKIKIR